MEQRLAVSYSVRVSLLESTRQQFMQPVVERQSDYGGKSAQQRREAASAV